MMDNEREEMKLYTEWIEKRQENSFICPVCGATIQKSDIEIHREWHEKIGK